jgi:catechol 2,3-dioxygenase-like lactoylglutathione lyase family enzyme
MRTLGIRHVALNVKDAQRSKEFYRRVFRMELEWEPDPENVYLTSGGMDNLAIHQVKDTPAAEGQRLDHIGFILPTMADVDQWYAWMKTQGVKIARDIKTHRDGARSFYCEDPDGVGIQLIYHPPISDRNSTD